MNVIEVENLSKRYKNFQALNCIGFNVKKGEIFGLLGPNGAGKTTTIKILTTQIRPDSGTVRILGLDAIARPATVKEKFGIVFEDKNFYPRLSVEQNLMFFAQLYGKGRKEVDKALDFIKLDHRRREEAGKLSSGMKQRLVIARALLPDPDVFFLDEPTVGLDPHMARDIRQVFKDLRSRGKTILLTTHYMEEADELCDRIAFINEGTIVKTGTPVELKESLGPGEIIIETFEEGETAPSKTVFRADSAEGAKALEKAAISGEKFRLSLKKASLEDVFIHNTGSKLE